MSSWGSTASGEREMSTFPQVHCWNFVDTHHTRSPGYIKRVAEMMLGEFTVAWAPSALQVPKASPAYRVFQSLPVHITLSPGAHGAVLYLEGHFAFLR